MTATSVAAAHQVDAARLPRLAVLGPTIQFITGPADDRTPCIMRGTIPAGVVIPLHAHPDPETFWVVSGSVEGYTDHPDRPRWVRLAPGDIWDVPGNARHAFRNTGQDAVVTIVVSTARLGRFFQEAGRHAPPSAETAWPPPESEVKRFLEIAARYGHWTASPEENARIGIVM